MKDNNEKIIKQQITQKLNQMLQKRLKIRIQQKLQKHYTNCQYSTPLNRFYICSHKSKLTKNSYRICSDNYCNGCEFYTPKYDIASKQIIQEQFYNDIKNPATCGNKQPKIAMLIWVLKLFNQDENNQYFQQCKKNNFWGEIIKWIKSGFASK